jgi:hypothetical protein
LIRRGIYLEKHRGWLEEFGKMKFVHPFLRMTLLGMAFLGGAAGARASAPGVPSPAKNLGHIFLPEQVPYLNTKQRYPVGNGVAMAVSEPDGKLTYLYGPGYGTPNLLTSETLTLEVDGVEKPLSLEMKRARETGVYYGVAARGDLRVRLIDYANWGQPWFSRLLLIDNTSRTVTHDVRLKAVIHPLTGAGMTNWLVKDAGEKSCGMAIQADTTVDINGGFGGKNVADKSVVITFGDPATSASVEGEIYTLETAPHHLAPGGSYPMAISHYFRQDKTSDSQCIAAIRALNNVGEMEKSIAAWQSWFRDVSPGYRLRHIKDERARDMVEGGLAILKTNESQDGGLIAHSTFYKEGFIRDAALGLRGLAATGHFDESRRWLLWVNHIIDLYGFTPDAASCEASLADKGNKMVFGNPDVEEPALYLLCARDYYHATHDLRTLNAVHKSLQHCMDIQLKDAIANGYKLGFNGDETEICTAIDLTPAGTVMSFHAENQDWSLVSISLCAASLDFYMEYLQARGEDVTAYRNSQNGMVLNLNTELAHLLKAMHTDFWRTDVPGLPGGFHDSFRLTSTGAWPLMRIANLILMPVYFGTPYPEDEKIKDVAAIAPLFDKKTGFLQLVPQAHNGFLGHDLGYLLWCLVEVDNPEKTEVYDALVNGPTADCWGSFNESYTAAGVRNEHDLRTLETGCNMSALAKYWGLKP